MKVVLKYICFKILNYGIQVVTEKHFVRKLKHIYADKN